jgi:sugar lactone lactonase YvrE
MTIARVDTHRCTGGESPLWDAASQALFFVDNTFSADGQRLLRYSPASGQTAAWALPAPVTAIALRQDGAAMVALMSGLHALDLASGALVRLTDPGQIPPACMFNDGKVDRRGRFVLGLSTTDFASPKPDGGVWRLEVDDRLTALAGGIHISNGPCWSPDDKTLYISDCHESATYAFDYDIATGAVANKRLFADTRDLGGLPDGATVDRDGLVWIAIYRGGKVAAYRPEGRLERVVDMPTKLPSSVSFGGPELDRLYVTSIAREPLLGEADAEGGYLFQVDGLGARGIPEPRMAGKPGEAA